MTKIAKPKHDQLFKKALENPIVAYEFIETHLPKNLLDIIDMSSLKLEKESFVEQDLASIVKLIALGAN